MKILPKQIISTLYLLLFILISSSVWAIPMAEITYLETDLGNGTFQYDYNVANKSDPVEDAGFDIFEIFLYFDPDLTVSILSLPTDWSVFNAGFGFIQTSSDLPGPIPEGADIGPGMSLNEFSFLFNRPIGNIDFLVNFWDSAKDEIGPEYAGTTAPVPEPASILLVAGGLLGIGVIGRKKIKKTNKEA